MAASTSRKTQLSKENLVFLRKCYVLSQACMFVKPYWKGEMRQLRMDLDGREREIVIEEGGI